MLKSPCTSRSVEANTKGGSEGAAEVLVALALVVNGVVEAGVLLTEVLEEFVDRGFADMELVRLDWLNEVVVEFEGVGRLDWVKLELFGRKVVRVAVIAIEIGPEAVLRELAELIVDTSVEPVKIKETVGSVEIVKNLLGS